MFGVQSVMEIYNMCMNHMFPDLTLMLLNYIDIERFEPNKLIDFCFECVAPDLALKVIELEIAPY